MHNIDTIRKLYVDFSRGDVAAILSACTPNSCWTVPGQPGISHAGTHVGVQAITAFFVGLAEHLNIESFVPQRFLSDGELVVAIGHYSGTGRRSGKPFTSRWVHTWSLSGGKVASFNDAYDTLAVAGVI